MMILFDHDDHDLDTITTSDMIIIREHRAAC